MTPEEYRQHMFAHLTHTKLDTETVSLADGLGRTLAVDAVAKLAVPPFDNSAMDGFAVRLEDFTSEGPWRFAVIQEVAAGDVGAERTLNADDADLPLAARIMTGAPMPQWADAVVKVEDTDAPRGASKMPRHVNITVTPKPHANVRFAGEDLPAGTHVIEAGTVLTPRALSALASIGYGEVQVARKPRVAILATGSELAPPGEMPGPGMIPDSNSTLLALLVRGPVESRRLYGRWRTRPSTSAVHYPRMQISSSPRAGCRWVPSIPSKNTALHTIGPSRQSQCSRANPRDMAWPVMSHL